MLLQGREKFSDICQRAEGRAVIRQICTDRHCSEGRARAGQSYQTYINLYWRERICEEWDFGKVIGVMIIEMMVGYK